MVAGLLDTTVVVDLLRLYTPAHNWLAQQGQLGVSAIVWLEVIQGIQNKATQLKAVKQLNLFEQIDPTPADFEWAIRQALRFKLSHNSSAMDCLMAATSYRLQIPLYTPNLKHFTPLIGALAQRPY